MHVRSAALALLIAPAAFAGVTFSFQDPAPNGQLTNTEGGVAPGVGHVAYDQSAVLNFLIDGTADSLGTIAFANARMEFDMALSPGTTLGPITTAPISGFFRIYDASTSQDIVTGVASVGAYVQVLNSASLLFSDPNFTYIAGPALAGFLPSGAIFVPPTTGAFTLTNVSPAPGGGLMNLDGSFRSFAADASFSGASVVTPTPGSLALVGAGALTLVRRRR